MADGFQPMGGVPDSYTKLLNNANGLLVKTPDGMLKVVPQMQQPTTLSQIYGFSGTNDPTGPGPDWGALTGMLDDPIYSGQPYTPANTTYGQPPTSVAQTQAEKNAARRAAGNQALVAANTLAGIPQASGTMSTNKDQTRLQTTLLAFDGDQANGMVPGGGIGGASGAGGGATLQGSPVSIRVPYPRSRPPQPGDGYLSGDPGQTDWSVANNGMQGLAGPNDAKYLPNDPRNRPAGAKPLPKYQVSNAPGSFNRDTGTWNTGMPSSGSGLPNILGGLGGMGGGGLSLLGRLFGGGGTDTRQTLLQHIISGITSQPDPNGAAQAGLRLIPGVGSALAPSMPLVDLNKVSPDSPAAGLLSRNGGGLADGAQVSFRNPESQQRWLTGY